MSVMARVPTYSQQLLTLCFAATLFHTLLADLIDKVPAQECSKKESDRSRREDIDE